MDRERYVHTGDFDRARDTLQQHGWVVLCGPPGSGKTALAHALLRYVRERNFDPLVMTDAHDWVVQVLGARQTVVIMDGTLGEVRVDRRQHSQWRAALSIVTQLVRAGRCLLVLTVYPHVLRELRMLEEGTDSPLLDRTLQVELTGACLGPDVREAMLRSHLREVVEDQVRAVLGNRNRGGAIFPWCCQQLVRNWHVGDGATVDPDYLDKASAAAHVPLIKRMLHDPERGQSVAAVLLLTMQGLGRFLVTPQVVQTHLCQLGLTRAPELATHAQRLRGFILAEDGDGFMNRVIYEAAGLALGRSYLLPALLRVCDVRFLVQHVHTRETSPIHCVPIAPEAQLRKLFMRRIYSDLVSGFVVELAQHPSLQSMPFLKEFEAFLRQENKLKEALAAADPTHGMTLLYWSAWGEHGALMKWCLETYTREFSSFDLPGLLQGVAFASFLLCRAEERSTLPEVLQAIRQLTINVTRCFVVAIPGKERCLTRHMEGKRERLLQDVRWDSVCWLGRASLPVCVTKCELRDDESMATFVFNFCRGMPTWGEIFLHPYYPFGVRAVTVKGEEDAAMIVCTYHSFYEILGRLASEEVFSRIDGRGNTGLQDDMNTPMQSFRKKLMFQRLGAACFLGCVISAHPSLEKYPALTSCCLTATCLINVYAEYCL